MAALAKDRDTARRDGVNFGDQMAANAKIYAGSIVVLNATGYAAPGSTATGLKARGMAEEQVDNTGGADGAKTVRVRNGVFRFGNSAAADEITIADIGNNCYIVDDQTVAKTDGTGSRSVAGKIVDVDSHGVWVKFD